ncbi:uncharacterized protein [Montipora capricornis]|uniref:uncharacterized protein n=1 Tax=Montipora capricornis TaxID=246305 RepID=UPI0035F197FA
MPTLNEQLHRLAHAKCSSLVDVRDGFLHIPLDEESSHMTTMHTSYGHYRWRRLPFGISSAPEEFQMRLISALEGLEGIICIAYDILVFGEGTDFTEAEKDHDHITVHTDHQPLETIYKKPLHKSPVRLQRMLMRLQRYKLSLQYKKGTRLHIADTLSRAALPTPVQAKVTWFEVFRLELEHSDNDHNPRLTDVTEELLKSETKKDQTLTDLQQTITSSWPDDNQHLAPNLRPFWTCREERSTLNGIVYKVINKSKAHFARFGILQICHTDNGSHIASKEYENFATQYGFKHTTSSPYHTQGNGSAEAAVKVAKATLKKSADFQTALLNCRNTPPQGHTCSPAQRMLPRRTRTTLPTPNHFIKPSPVNLDVFTEELTLKRAARKRYYDNKPTKVHPELAVGSSVYAKPPPTQRSHPWIRRTIISQDTPRSYTIQTPTSNIRRNRVHITPTMEQPPPPKQTNPPPRLQEPPPHNGTLSIEPQAEETVANNQPPPQTLPPHLTRPEILPSNGPEKLATLPSQDHPPAPTLGNTRTRTRIIKPPLSLKDYELT